MALKEVTVTYKAEITHVGIIDEEELFELNEDVMKAQAQLTKVGLDADHVLVTDMKLFIRDIEEDKT